MSDLAAPELNQTAYICGNCGTRPGISRASLTLGDSGHPLLLITMKCPECGHVRIVGEELADPLISILGDGVGKFSIVVRDGPVQGAVQ